MMKRIHRIFVFVCLLAMSLSVKAQVLKEVKNAFDSYQNTFQEKMFVHTDKELYLTGELIWFKLYNVDAFSNLPADLSKVAYVEVLDNTNQPIAQAKISLTNGSGSGALNIPSTALNGNYKMRAYTSWMQNFGPNHFFEKQITLINPLNSPEKSSKNTNKSQILFFAEGGDMIEGISCNIGFKAVSAEGRGIALKGVVINQKNDTVARFQTLKFGIGQFTFKPLPDQTYKAIASTEQKEIIITTLPVAKKKGYALFLEDKGNETITISVSTNLNVNNVYLFVHQDNKASISEATTIANGKATFSIDKAKLMDGVSHLTLFNETGQAVAERLYFKRPSKQLMFSAKATYLTYKPREKVNVIIDANNEKREPEVADISVAVRRLDSLQGMDQSDIVNYFWLSSTLKGEIESPGYYFLNPNKETDKALDNLLLTQGWRRMVWDEVMNKKPTLTFLPEFNGHLVTGKINKTSSTAGTNIYLTISNTAKKFYSSLSDAGGHFMFNTKDFYGANEIIVQTNPTEDTTSIISIQSPFSEKYTAFNFADLALKPSQLSALKNHNIGTQVQNIYTAHQLNKFYPLSVDTNDFFGKPDKSYKLDDYTRFTLMEDVLREYVRETFISRSGKHFIINVLSRTDLLPGEPLVLVDGVPYFNTDRVMEIDPKKIKNLDIVKDYYYYGAGSFEGVLNFKSYKPNIAALEINPNAVVLDYEGMQLQREFYSPSYETPEAKNDRIPDFRNLLFWSPSTLIDKKGGAQLNFYTSDQPGIYIGVINGLSKTGIPGSSTFTFEVK